MKVTIVKVHNESDDNWNVTVTDSVVTEWKEVNDEELLALRNYLKTLDSNYMLIEQITPFEIPGLISECIELGNKEIAKRKKEEESRKLLKEKRGRKKLLDERLEFERLKAKFEDDEPTKER